MTKETLNLIQVSVIHAIGVDIQEISTIKQLIDNYGEKFLKKVFTVEEIKYCKNKINYAQHYCARFCVKEAFFKALGTGIGNNYNLSDVSCINLESGQPVLRFHGQTSRHMVSNNLEALVSLSHTDNYAVANVLLKQNVQV
ncbi:holo-ACP synthase [Priestia koreensis]|uniref:holo-ACP synthase n=1 Tax=Priestia koreensis TaxID=284581 RepID=UPI003D01F4D8